MSSGSHDDVPEVVVRKGRGVSLIWLVPAVAVVVGGYMAWQAWQDRGVEVVITFPTAEWLEAGKTKVEFRSVQVGSVDKILFVPAGVELHCTLDQQAKPYLTEDAKFWIEHPRVGGGQVSGLGTLLSGAYIAMRLGDPSKKAQRKFAGLSQPPVEPEGEKGLRIVLEADELYGVSAGTRVYYRQLEVGKVDAYTLAESGARFDIHLFIRQGYEHLVRDDSRFWNAGGIQISGGLANLDVTTPSLASMLAGGIAFDAPSGKRAPGAKDGARFHLLPDRAAVHDYAYSEGGLHVVAEAPHLGGIQVGDPVSYRELTVGEVVSRELSADSRRLRLHLNVQRRYAPLVRSNSVFWNASGISANLGLSGLHIHAESLQALLRGGVAFATPDDSGYRVKSGSVFALQPEPKEEWLKWDPALWRGRASEASSAGAPQEAKTEAEKKEAAHERQIRDEGKLARFFHHAGKSEEEAAADAEPAPQPSDHERRRGHLKRR